MKNVDSKSHVRGESIYLDDIALLQDTLYACVSDSPTGRARRFEDPSIFQKPNVRKALSIYFGARFNRQNEIGGILHDEPLLAERKVIFRECPSRSFWRNPKNRRALP